MNESTRQNALLGTLAQSVLLASMGTSMANLALPAIGADFGIEFASTRLVVLSYLLATTVFSLIIGRLADLKGRRLTLFVGTALFVVASLIAASALSFWILVLARVLQGIGAAALVVLPIILATETVSPNKTGRSIGLLSTMSAVGTASGPTIGGLLLATHGWRSLFLVIALLGALNLLLLLIVAKKDEPEFSLKVQSLGEASRYIFLNSPIRMQLLYNLVVSAVMMSTLIVGPFYLSNALHQSPVSMGMIMSAGPITSIISGLFSGFAVDRFGARLIGALGFAQLLIGTLSFVLLPTHFDALGFAISAVLLSFGYQLFLSANSSSIMKTTATEHRGLASGALSLSRNLGLIAGSSVLAGIFDLFAGISLNDNQAPVRIVHGLQAVFAVAALLILILLTSHLINEQRSKSGTRFPI